MKFKSQGKQLSISTFRSSLDSLSKSNRWVRLGDSLPWDEIEIVYNSKLNNSRKGAGNKSARMIVGALIVKHKMNLSDVETICAIQENPYMQYLLGLSEFTDKPVFDSSLFVTIRKRLQIDDLNAFTQSLMNLRTKADDNNDDDSAPLDSNKPSHKGDMKIDATCSDAEVRYPTDIDLLHDGSRVINHYIDMLCKLANLPHPTTFSKQARRAYLEVIKHKKKSRKMIHTCKTQLLTYLGRDIHCFISLIAVNGSQLLDWLNLSQKRTLRAIITMYHQQNEMYKQGVHTCVNRIISIFQPHIRPIVRGKAKALTEFGAKIGASIVDGYTFIDHHSWDAYNECNDLELQIELYHKRFGCLPERIYADKIYLNRANRQLMKDLGIEAMGKPLGRPPKQVNPAHEIKMAKSVGERNEIEATFGTGKRVYRANNIRAKLPETANSWTGMCYFVKNVMKFLKELRRLLSYLVKLLKNPATIRCYFNNEKGFYNLDMATYD